MTDSAWLGIRPGAYRLDVYNEATLVYLFDEAHLELLKQSGADFQGGFSEEEAEVDERLRRLARDGLYVAYELQQDDEVAVEVVVGPPLTRKELTVARWLKPQRAFLKLPSGKLRIDTANTLPIHDEEQEDRPGIVVVPPGDYVLTLYRIDWTEMKNDGLVADGRPWHGPEEVIVLTPSLDSRSVRNKSFLRYPKPANDIWQGRYEIAGNKFYGLAMTQYWWDNINVNIDRAAADKLGLRPGMSFCLEVADFVFEVVHFGEADTTQIVSPQWERWAKSLAGNRKEFGVSYRFRGISEFDHFLTFPRIVSTKAFPIHARWMPATATLLPEQHEIPTSILKLNVSQ